MESGPTPDVHNVEEDRIYALTSRIMLWIGISLVGLGIVYLMIAGISVMFDLRILYITASSAVVMLAMVFGGIALIERSIVRMGSLEISIPNFLKR